MKTEIETANECSGSAKRAAMKTETTQPSAAPSINRFHLEIEDGRDFILNMRVKTKLSAKEIRAAIAAAESQSPSLESELAEALRKILAEFVTKENYPSWTDGALNDAFIQLSTTETLARVAIAKYDAKNGGKE